MAGTMYLMINIGASETAMNIVVYDQVSYNDVHDCVELVRGLVVS